MRLKGVLPPLRGPRAHCNYVHLPLGWLLHQQGTNTLSGSALNLNLSLVAPSSYLVIVQK